MHFSKIISNIIVLFLFIAAPNSFAQQADKAVYKVKGVLVDSITSTPEPYANVYIRSKSHPERVIKMFITNANGTFSQEIPYLGDYTITFSSVGKNTVIRTFSLNSQNKNVDFGNISISDNVTMLKNVEVISRRQLIKVDIDKIEYNVASDPIAAVSNVLEMLNKVPYVSVDGLDGIKVMGTSKFKIYINGRPTGIATDNIVQYLKSMPASAIKSIQLITNPGVKYDAEDNSAIINIVKQKIIGGYLVSLSDRIANTIQDQSIYSVFQTKKLSITGNTSLYTNDFPYTPHSYTDKKTTDFESQMVETLHQDVYDKTKTNPTIGLEMNYEPDSLRLIFGSINYTNMPSSSFYNEQIAMKDENEHNVYSYDNKNRYDIKNSSRVIQIGYQRKSKKKDKSISFSYQNSYNPKHNNRYVNYSDIINAELPYSGIWTDSRLANLENAFQTDFSYSITSKQHFNLGLKGIWRNNKDDYHYYGKNGGDDYKEDGEQSYNYIQKQNIYAVYAEYGIEWKKWSLKGGLRYEYTHLNVNGTTGFKNNYDNLVPSIALFWKINECNQLKLVYGYYINRPGINALDPHVNNLDPKNLYYGNPSLKCEKDHDINLYYNCIGNKWDYGMRIAYSKTIDNISSYIYPVANVLHHTYRNVGHMDDFVVNLYLDGKITSFLNGNLNMTYGLIQYKYPEDGIDKTGSFYGIDGSFLLSLPLKMKLNIDYYFDSNSITPQGKESSIFNSYGLKLFRNFCKGNFSVSMYAYDFFKPSVKFNSWADTGTYRYNSTCHSYRRRSFGMTFDYRFGKLKKRIQNMEYKISNTDIKNVKSGE